MDNSKNVLTTLDNEQKHREHPHTHAHTHSIPKHLWAIWAHSSFTIWFLLRSKSQPNWAINYLRCCSVYSCGFCFAIFGSNSFTIWLKFTCTTAIRSISNFSTAVVDVGIFARLCLFVCMHVLYCIRAHVPIHLYCIYRLLFEQTSLCEILFHHRNGLGHKVLLFALSLLDKLCDILRYRFLIIKFFPFSGPFTIHPIVLCIWCEQLLAIFFYLHFCHSLHFPSDALQTMWIEVNSRFNKKIRHDSSISLHSFECMFDIVEMRDIKAHAARLCSSRARSSRRKKVLKCFRANSKRKTMKTNSLRAKTTGGKGWGRKRSAIMFAAYCVNMTQMMH